MNNGITVTNILPTEKDASEMGFSQINKKLKNTESTEFSDIISQNYQLYDNKQSLSFERLTHS